MQVFYEVKTDEVLCQYRDHLEFPKHLHRQVELAVMLEGSTRVFADDKGGALTPGQAFIAFPNQVHHYVEDSERLRCLLFIFSPDLLPAFYTTFLKKVPQNPILSLDLPRLRPVLTMLDEEIRHPQKYTQAVLEGGLSLLLAALFRQAVWETSAPRNINATRQILDYCNAHYTGAITLDDVAADTHMSKYYISRLFAREVGMSFPAYINALRVHDAQDLLLDGGMSVTDVAYAVGFSSLRSFNRHFLAITGKTPSEFKKGIEE